MVTMMRPMTETDSENLISLMQEADGRDPVWAEKTVLAWSRQKGKTLIVAEEADQLVGYAGIKEAERENQNVNMIIGETIDSLAVVNWLAVHPIHRRKGIASTLLKHCEAWAHDRRRAGLWLSCREKLLGLYEKNGYSALGSYMDSGSQRYIMVKPLGDSASQTFM